ncbi:hypothetical protein NKG05_08110 [Oerskovia sp. M15]
MRPDRIVLGECRGPRSVRCSWPSTPVTTAASPRSTPTPPA